MTDLLIAGGGPAGLATALYARRAGLEVLVLDPRRPPIDKACGEGLMPRAVDALADLGVHPAGVAFRGIRYLDGRAPEARVEALFSSGAGLGVRRTELHRAMTAAADTAGVRVERLAVRDVREVSAGADRVEARCADGRLLRAGWLVAADGLHSEIRAGCGLAGRPTRYRRFGLRRHFDLQPWTDLVEVYWSPVGEAYVTPVGPTSVGVALLGPGGSFDERLTHFPALARRLAGVPAGPVRGAGPLRQRVRRRVAGRVLLVGDAAGYVDALTGEGIALALRTSELLVGCVAAGRPDDYERLWLRETRHHRVLTGSLVGATRVPVLRRALVPAARRVPAVFTGVVDSLTRR